MKYFVEELDGEGDDVDVDDGVHAGGLRPREPGGQDRKVQQIVI